MRAKDFEAKFEAGEDLTEHLDYAHATRPLQKQRRVNVDFPQWMIDRLDKEAQRMGVTRQSVIKVWLSERLEQTRQAR